MLKIQELIVINVFSTAVILTPNIYEDERKRTKISCTSEIH